MTNPGYFDRIRDANEALDDALAAIRAEQDAHKLTPLQAAAERVELYERHIAECRRLAAAYHLDA